MASSDPAPTDPAPSDPAPSDPASGDPASGDPASGDQPRIPCPPPLTLQHPDGDASVQFFWRDDRYEHTVFCGDASLQSHDRCADQAWPECPPVQQLSIEAIDNRQVALGVGCAGTSHWSMSVEPVAGGFRFDWACRAKQTPDRLGSRYAGEDSLELRGAEETVTESDHDSLAAVPRQVPDGAGTFRWCYTVTRKQAL